MSVLVLKRWQNLNLNTQPISIKSSRLACSYESKLKPQLFEKFSNSCGFLVIAIVNKRVFTKLI